MPDLRFTTEIATALETATTDIAALKAKAAAIVTPEHLAALETSVNSRVDSVESRFNSALAEIEAKLSAFVAAHSPTQ